MPIHNIFLDVFCCVLCFLSSLPNLASFSLSVSPDGKSSSLPSSLPLFSSYFLCHSFCFSSKGHNIHFNCFCLLFHPCWLLLMLPELPRSNSPLHTLLVSAMNGALCSDLHTWVSKNSIVPDLAWECTGYPKQVTVVESVVLKHDLRKFPWQEHTLWN